MSDALIAINKKIAVAIDALPAHDVTYASQICEALEKQIAEVEGVQACVADARERLKVEILHESAADIAHAVTDKWVNELSSLHSELQAWLSSCQSHLSVSMSVRQGTSAAGMPDQEES